MKPTIGSSFPKEGEWCKYLHRAQEFHGFYDEKEKIFTRYNDGGYFDSIYFITSWEKSVAKKGILKKVQDKWHVDFEIEGNNMRESIPIRYLYNERESISNLVLISLFNKPIIELHNMEVEYVTEIDGYGSNNIGWAILVAARKVDYFNNPDACPRIRI